MDYCLKVRSETSDDNDTFAGREYGSWVLTRDMLQRERVLQGARRRQCQSDILRPTPVAGKSKCISWYTVVYQERAGNRETDMLCGLLFEEAMGRRQAFQVYGWGLGSRRMP